ncbi:hypothetical protein OG21DRAFT_1491519 [Imleria badia]|nr:hypothetical protein OG21DRAFT_1491519 [Imleria badia]
MAPAHPADTAYGDEESQIPPWAESSTPFTQVGPTFTVRSSESDQYGFKVPSQPGGDHDTEYRARFTGTRTMSSAVSSQSSHPSSRSSSVFSTGVVLHASSTFTPASSCASSECGTSNAHGIAPDDIDTSRPRPKPGPRSLQLRMLAAAAAHPSSAVPESRKHSPFVEDKGSNEARLPPQQPVLLRRTCSFVQLPLSLPRKHTILILDTDVGGGFDGIADDINEMLPDEDEHIAESIVRDNFIRGPTQHNENTATSTVSSNHQSSTELVINDDTPNSQRLSRNVEDVVMQHHQHNCPPRLPDNNELMTIRNQQASQRSVSCTNSVVDDSPGNTNLPAVSLPQSAFGSVASGLRADNADSSQLSFYPPAVRDIIERTKQLSHCDLGSINSFPMRPQFNTKADEYMNEAIVERCRHRLVIPEGEQYPCFLILRN